MTHKDHDHHKCMALFEKMSEYIDRELDDEARAQVEMHIRACCHCQACYETLQRTVDLCRSSDSVLEIATPSGPTDNPASPLSPTLIFFSALLNDFLSSRSGTRSRRSRILRFDLSRCDRYSARPQPGPKR